VAVALTLPLERRAEIEEYLREKFRRMDRDMPESNLVQADVPRGARYILPERGTAPGLALEVDGRRVYVVPGVPAEMREMMEGTILPELREATAPSTLVSRVLRVTGIPEAGVGELLDDVFRGSGNPSLAFLASAGEVRLRITAKAGTREGAEALIEPMEKEIRERLGDAVFGSDEEELEAVVGRLLSERELWVACAESLTGGGLAARITSVPNASRYFAGGAVAYSPDAKKAVLGVSSETIAEHGTVSERCALEMARGVRRVFGANIGISTTGVAGPDELEGQPPGTVWVGLAADDADEARTFRAPGDREQVRRWAEQAALDLLRKYLLTL
jgi:nicotinamide-nucleotide amidase